MKITKKDVQGVFKRFLKALGGRLAVNYKDQGAFDLEYNTEYGGWLVEEITGDMGAIDHPFLNVRLTTKEMYWALLMASRALEYKEKGR